MGGGGGGGHVIACLYSLYIHKGIELCNYTKFRQRSKTQDKLGRVFIFSLVKTAAYCYMKFSTRGVRKSKEKGVHLLLESVQAVVSLSAVHPSSSSSPVLCTGCHW